MIDILSLNKEQIIQLQPESITWLLTTREVIHIAKTLDAFWQYDYEAANQGRVGMHASLKSKRHSDGFFVSRIMLQHPNVQKIMAYQMAMHLKPLISFPVWVAGIPDGATRLGEDLAEILGSKVAKMEKVDGKIRIVSQIGPDEKVLLCEDFCTRGTGFREAVLDIVSKQPDVDFIFIEPVIINRGGLKCVEIPGVGYFYILAIAENRVSDWNKDDCPLCQMGSKPIKPKAKDENWKLITNSQK
jgi:orotate phosphoribosyltransferase